MLNKQLFGNISSDSSFDRKFNTDHEFKNFQAYMECMKANIIIQANHLLLFIQNNIIFCLCSIVTY